MKKQLSLVVLASLFLGSVAVVPASAKTAKECTAEWRADKAGMQARGTTEKAYVDQCKEGAAPTATAPPPAAPTPSAAAPKTGAGPATQKSAKDCLAEWRADKAGMQARGVTEKAYVDQCRGGAEPTAAAPVAPKPPVGTIAPAPTLPAPTAQKPAPATVARQASEPTGPAAQAGEYANEAQAKAHCPGTRWFGQILAQRSTISVAARATEPQNAVRICARRKQRQPNTGRQRKKSIRNGRNASSCMKAPTAQ